MTFQARLAALNARSIAAFGQPVTYTQSSVNTTSPVAPFTVQAIVETGGQYADPLSKAAGEVSFQLSDLPFEPSAGDFIVIQSVDIPSKAGRTYLLLKPSPEQVEGMVKMLIRWSGN